MKCRLDEKVMTTEAWLLEHSQHQTTTARILEADAGHPSGDWRVLTCPCGARHTTTKLQHGKG